MVTRIVWLCFVLSLWQPMTLQAAPQIIVHPSVAVEKLSVAQLRSIFLMRQLQWPNGAPIRVFVLTTQSAGHQQFSKECLQLFPYQVERVWQKLTYSGIATPPTELSSDMAMLEMISTMPGAIGYVEQYDERYAAKVLPLQ